MGKVVEAATVPAGDEKSKSQSTSSLNLPIILLLLVTIVSAYYLCMIDKNILNAVFTPFITERDVANTTTLVNTTVIEEESPIVVEESTDINTKYKNKDGEVDKNKDIVVDREKDTVINKENPAIIDNAKDTVKNKEGETTVDKDRVINREQGTTADKEKVTLKNKGKDTVINKEKDTVADKAKDKTVKVKKVKKKKRDNITNIYDKKISSYISDGEKLLKSGKYEECVSFIEKTMKKYSLSPRLAYGHAECLNQLAEKKKSNAMLEKAIEAYGEVANKPDITDELLKRTLMTRAKRQIFLGHTSKAVATLKNLCNRLPKNIDALNELGISYLVMGKNNLALNPFNEVLKLDKNNGVAKVHKGFIIKSQTKYKESIPYLLEGIRSGEPLAVDSRFYFHLGDAYNRVGFPDKAREIYQEGADRKLFLSAEQRSTYNAETKLRAKPWWTPEETGYVEDIKLLERNWKTIRDEAVAIMDKDKNVFPLETEDLLDKGDWRQFDLYSQGKKKKQNCAKVPKTCAVIDRIQDAVGNKRGQIKYSIMQPGTHVWPHTGPTNCRLRMHLGLIIPKDVHIRVARETRTWKNGKIIIIDDSFDHEVWHNGTKPRMIFIVDFWHPDIPQWERKRLSPI